MQYILIISNFLFFCATAVNATCLSDPMLLKKQYAVAGDIKEITIAISNSNKFYKNIFRAITEQETFIPKKYKKKFAANISFNKEWTNCNVKAFVKITGDGRDHLTLTKKRKCCFFT